VIRGDKNIPSSAANDDPQSQNRSKVNNHQPAKTKKNKPDSLPCSTSDKSVWYVVQPVRRTAGVDSKGGSKFNFVREKSCFIAVLGRKGAKANFSNP
jgi:hypothetical protein